MQKLPCFLCGRQLDRRIDRNEKPYFVCDPCGAQIFIRRKTGIENLNELIRTLKGRNLPLREHARVLYKIQAVLAEIRGLKRN
jgi:DNA-directed RNA polymerase subunit RPC12/RpoP